MANSQWQGPPSGPQRRPDQALARPGGGPPQQGEEQPGWYKTMQLRDDGLYQINTQAELLRVANLLKKSGVLPQAFRTDEQASIALQCLVSLGLNPIVSARNTSYVKGAFTIFGDLPMALVRKSGQLEAYEEFTFTQSEDGKRYLKQCFDNGNCHEDAFGAACRVKRKGMEVHEIVFTLKQAEQAGLWAKGRKSDAPWQKYTSRMLMMRARSQALKDCFADVLMGVQIQEYDIEGVYDQPPPQRPAKPPADKVIEVPKQTTAAQREEEIERRASPTPRHETRQAQPVGETGAEIVGLTPQAKRPGVASRA